MYTAVVGRTFLKEYNDRNSTSLSAIEFFSNVLFPIFFDGEKYLMWAQNSPFVQGLNKRKPFFEPLERLERLERLHEKIGGGNRDASIAIGFPASETKEFATTSSLVTDLEMPSDDETIYLSWIGGALGLGVAGGYALLFDDPQITYSTFEGWQVYRSFLSDPANEKLRGNQITTWNGQWLTLKFGKRFQEDFDFQYFVNKKAISVDTQITEVNTIAWSELFFSLSRAYSSTDALAYVYSLGQTNKTIGFIPFRLSSGRLIHEVYNKLFAKDEYMINRSDFESLFGKHIKRACELGNIGLQALEPKSLKKYFSSDSNLKLSKSTVMQRSGEDADSFESRRKNVLKKDKVNIINFRIYKTWLVAMISKNKTEISDYTRDVATALVAYRAGAKKMDRKNLLEKELFATKRKVDFLEALIKIVKDPKSEVSLVKKINGLRDRVHFMSKEDFVYFVLLLKFDYAFQERIS